MDTSCQSPLAFLPYRIADVGKSNNVIVRCNIFYTKNPQKIYIRYPKKLRKSFVFKDLRCTKFIRNLYGMPSQDKYEDLTPAAFREYSRRFRECADKLTALAAQMEENNLESVFIAIVDARNKLERLEGFIDGLNGKTSRAVNRVREDTARYGTIRRGRKKKDG